MLEKKANNILVTKLYAILLLKADFNTANKIIFNTRIILQMEYKNEIPREIVEGCRSQSAIHIVINKKIMADIANQSKLSHIIISADTSNCFDRVAYSISAMTCYYFGLPHNYISIVFYTIQNIEMYLITLYGISDSFYTGTATNLF